MESRLDESQANLRHAQSTMANAGPVLDYWGEYLDASQAATAGLPGVATITAATDSGVHFNACPLLDIELLVVVPERPPYAIHRREMVTDVLLPQVRIGWQLKIKVLPDNPSAVWIDWPATLGGR